MKYLRGIIRYRVLLIILCFSILLNTIGLYPNTLLHPNEPGLVGVADQIFKNTIFNGNPDPNLEPHPFKYGSALYYIQAFGRGSFLLVSYFFVDTFGINFGFTDAELSHRDFRDYIENSGPFAFRVQILWLSRFVSALFGTSCVLLIFLICQRLFKDLKLSYLSALALAVIPQHVRDSHYATVDVPLSFFILLSFFFTIRLWQKNTLKNLLLAGVFAGFASALKYYPLAFVPLLIVLLSFGLKTFLKRVFIVIFSGILGYIIAMPYVFVHLDKILAFIPFVLWWQAPDQLVENRSFLSRFLPTYYHQYHLKFLFNEGILPVPFITGIIGLLIGILKYRFKFLLIASIPVSHFLFVNFYIKQIYEYILIPMLPFFAIFIGTAINIIINFLKSKISQPWIFKSLSILLVLVIFVPAFIYDVRVGLACSKEITDFQAREWVLKNIPENSTVAFHPGTRHPSMEMNWVLSEILADFSLAEIQDQNAQYMIFIDGYSTIYTYWSSDFINPPKNLFNNEYVQLVENEFAKQSPQLIKFQKPYLCAGNTITIYKIPPKLSLSQTKIFSNNLNSIEDFRKFKLLGKEETQIAYVTSQGHLNNGSIRFTTPHKLYNDFRNTYFYYSTPILSDSVPATPGKKYTISGWIKPETQINKSQKDGYLRIDFYSGAKDDPISINLSPKATTSLEWQELIATGIAPVGTKYIKFGFQSLSIEDNQSFLLDDFTIYSN